MIASIETKKNRLIPRRVRARSSETGSERIIVFKESFFIELIAKKILTNNKFKAINKKK
jgi:hypothetical protein